MYSTLLSWVIRLFGPMPIRNISGGEQKCERTKLI